MVQNFLTNYLDETDTLRGLEFCDEDCGFGTSKKFKSQEDFWIH